MLLRDRRRCGRGRWSGSSPLGSQRLSTSNEFEHCCLHRSTTPHHAPQSPNRSPPLSTSCCNLRELTPQPPSHSSWSVRRPGTRLRATRAWRTCTESGARSTAAQAPRWSSRTATPAVSPARWAKGARRRRCSASTPSSTTRTRAIEVARSLNLDRPRLPRYCFFCSGARASGPTGRGPGTPITGCAGVGRPGLARSR